MIEFAFSVDRQRALYPRRAGPAAVPRKGRREDGLPVTIVRPGHTYWI